MIAYNRETPILLFHSGSVETIKQIYSILQLIEPQRLYLVFNATETDVQIVAHEQIQSLFAQIGWRCKVKTLYNKTNLEQDAAWLKAIRWFFGFEQEGIVLEGFNLPFPAFFAFCSCLLEKYRNDERIGHISGQDFLQVNRSIKTKDSYYFSKLTDVSSGWASWKRVWQDMDAQLKTLPAFEKLNIIEEIPSHKPFRFQWHYLNHFEKFREARCEYANLINNRLSVVPNTLQIPFNEYELPEMKHPKFMVTPVQEELKWQEHKYHIPAVTHSGLDSITFLQEKLLSFTREAAGRMKIPRIIHQIYEDPAGPPPNMLRIAESWKENHSGWEYRFWNKRMMHNFLEFHCPDFLPYYRSFPFNVQRWDAIRYLILYHIGGLYVDFDYECIRPLDVLLTNATCCMGMEPEIHKLSKDCLPIGNALMASVPKHPYMKAIIDDMKTNFSTNYGKGDTMQIMASTGPLLVARVYKHYKKKKEVTLLPADWVSPLSIREIWMLHAGQARPDVLEKIEKAFALHYCFGLWRSQTAEGKTWPKFK